MGQEYENTLGSVAITWGTVSAMPVSGGDASGLARIRITRKALLKQLQIRLAGSWDQSVGAESQATEGNPVLIQEMRLDLNGVKRRLFPGPVMFELNRIRNGGAGLKVDPATGTGTGKAFSSTIIFDMGYLDLDGASTKWREKTYLDLANFDNVYLEVQFAPFNRYVSGSTQANMAATLTVEEMGIYGVVRVPQDHFECRKVAVVSLANSGSDLVQDLLRSRGNTRGWLLRAGTLGATPIVTSTAALTNLGIRGTLKAGPTQEIKQKLPVANYQSGVGVGRNGISLTSGYLFLDNAHNKAIQGVLVGKNYSDLQLLYDVAGTAAHQLEVYQLMAAR